MQVNDDQSAAASRTRKQPKLLRLVVIVVIVAGVIYGVKKTRYQFIARNFGVVETGEIYRSGRLTPRMFRKVVGENNIKTVLDLGAYQPGSPEDLREQQLAVELGAKLQCRHHPKGSPAGQDQGGHSVENVRRPLDSVECSTQRQSHRQEPELWVAYSLAAI